MGVNAMLVITPRRRGPDGDLKKPSALRIASVKGERVHRVRLPRDVEINCDRDDAAAAGSDWPIKPDADLRPICRLTA
jgi:hypothetical protein